MSEARTTVIPNFLVASTPTALRRLMLINNRKLSAWHDYKISQGIDGRWYAWFHAEFSNDANLNLAGEDKGEIKGDDNGGGE